MLHFIPCKLLRTIALINIFILAILAPGHADAQFTAGNLSVLQVGNGTGALSNAAWPLFVVEYSLTGTETYSISLSSSGATAVTNSGTATSEGQMTMSAERDRLIIAGYNANAGTATVASSAAAAYPRELVVMNPSGTYSTAASTTTLYDANNIRSGSASATNYFSGGTVTNPGGTAYLNTGTTLTTSPGINTRVVQIFNGQLYFTSAVTPNVGVNMLSAGLPTTCCQTASVITASTTGSPYGFSISPDGKTLYVADDASGIVKYAKSAGTYTLVYTVNTQVSRSITVDYSGTNPIIYATTATSTTSNNIIKITDVGASSPATTLASSPTNTVYRSITFSPSCSAAVSVVGTPSVCAGSTVKFVIKGNPTGSLAYNVNGGSTLTTTIGANGYDTLTMGPLSANTTINLLNITTQACNSVTVTSSASVNVYPAVSVSATTVDPPLCAGTALHLGATIAASASPYNYSWQGPLSYTNTSSSALLTSSVTITTGSLTPTNPVYTLTVTDAHSCTATASITATVNPTPYAYNVFGSGSYCSSVSGVDVQLNNSQSGVTYYLYNGSTLVNTVAGTGSPLDLGVQPAGTYTVYGSYSVTGCNNNMIGTASISVNPTPGIITGTLTVCSGLTTTLTDGTSGATWTSGTTSVATVGSTGIVTGHLAGTSVISYSFATGCRATATVTVNPTPTAYDVIGSGEYCAGTPIVNVQLDGSQNGVTYYLYNGSTIVSTVTSTGGPFGFGTQTAGTYSVLGTYTLTGCSNSMIGVSVITEDAVPGPITGPIIVCVGDTINLSDTSASGSWDNDDYTIGTIDPSLGQFIGVGGGTTIVKYSFASGCSAYATVTVNPAPPAYNVTGSGSYCSGLSGLDVQLDNSDADVTYKLYNGSTLVSTMTGVGSALDFGTQAAGVYTVSGVYTVTGCSAAMSGEADITMNPVPAVITGTTTVCAGNNITLSDSSPLGTWSSGTTAVATISSTGVVSGVAAGTSIITYAFSTGCSVVATITVNPLSAILGNSPVCMGGVLTLSDATTGGAWGSTNSGVATIDGFGHISTVGQGTTTISYTLLTGCVAAINVTVNPLPATITGTLSVCVSSTTQLSDSDGGGTWSSNNTGLATIGSTSGNVSGVAQGFPVITYTLPTGCSITGIVTVNPLPFAITGVDSVCKNSATNLTDGYSGGAWGSSNTGVATVNGTGIVSALNVGTTSISYALITGCKTSVTVTVEALPAAISGSLFICSGSTTTLTDANSGGTWSSDALTVATIGSSSGFVNAGVSGVAGITYTLPDGCATGSSLTVNAMPATITGTMSVCSGSSTALTDINSGGTWASSNIGVASVSSTGVVTGAGATTTTAIITYTIPPGCSRTTIVTVNALPQSINGVANVCSGLTTSLSDASAGGTWTSSNSSVAAVGSSGMVTGGTAGTAYISYTISSGCAVTDIVTVNQLPTSINGTTNVCVGSITSLSNATPGGTWSSAATGTATVDGSGNVTGVSWGTVNISYQFSGCATSVPVTVDSLPTLISGNPAVCFGSTTNLTDAGGGTWTSSLPAVAAVGSGSGVVTGVSSIGGTATITYTLPTSCKTTTTVTVNTLPAVITGTMNVCAGSTTALTDANSGGTWSSSNTSIGTVGLTSGIVYGAIAGTTTISYTLSTGCRNIAVVTVNPVPTAINGNLGVCINATTTLSDAGSGTWTSSIPTTASIGSSSGIVTGLLAGTTTIVYTLPTGCSSSSSTAIVTVNPSPNTISGALNVCPGATTTLSDAGSGTWSSSNTIFATVGSTSGIVTGLVTGTTIISYKLLTTSCIATAIVTINTIPFSITGNKSVCMGFTTSLSDVTTGGTWSSNLSSTASVGSTGIVTGSTPGTATISYTGTNGCSTTAIVTVDPIPTFILGNAAVCPGTSTSLSDLTTGGTWSSSNLPVATIGSASGTLAGVAPGTANITYTSTGNCIITTIATVNPLPLAIAGSANVCIGSTIWLTDPIVGGTWSSSLPGIGSVDAGTGVVTGVSGGSVTITYTLPTGCVTTKAVTVNGAPTAINGVRSVCAGYATTNLTDAVTGGTWSSSDIFIAPVSATSGVVTGFAPGTATITYTSPLGCNITTIVTVNPLPGNIMGVLTVCPALTTLLSDGTGVGSWSSGNIAVGTIDALSGMVTGIAAGTTNITYMLSTGCAATAVVTVAAVPAAINGVMQVCTGSITVLTDMTTGGAWSASGTNVAIDAASGAVTGAATGTAIVTYTNAAGCIVTAVVTDNPLPSAISGVNSVCVGLITSLSDLSTGGSWSTTGASGVITLGSTGMVNGLTAGTATVIYTLPTGCTISTVVTVDPLPSNISGSLSMCVAGANVLTDMAAGGMWSVDPLSSTVASIDATSGSMNGLIAGTASVTYTLSTGCITTTIITVNPLPANISGTTNVCVGSMIGLSDATAGGIWISGNTSYATVGTSGVVTGVSAGAVGIIYQLPTGCIATITITVNPLPSAITGNRSICIHTTSSLSDGLTGGTWSASNSSISPIDILSGSISGFSLGTDTVTYVLPTGCSITATVTVNPYPTAITGDSVVCQGMSIYLSDSVTGGAWASSNIAKATINSGTGFVTGVAGGAVTITYTPSTGCYVTRALTVNPIFPISGNTNVCVGSVNILSDATTGGTWSGGSTLIATIGSASGAVSAIAPGNTIVTYTLSSGCVVVGVVSVNALPANYYVTGGGSFCAGSTGMHIGINGSDTGISYILYDGVSPVDTFAGTGSAMDFGTYSISGTYTVLATNTAGCISAMDGSATITPVSAMVPGVSLNAFPGTTVCIGSAATFIAIPVNGGTAPVYTWYVNNGIVASGAGASYSYIPASGDVVKVKLTSTMPCAAPDTAVAFVTMSTASNLTPSVNIVASPGDSVCPGTLVTISPVPFNGGTPTYTWMKNGINVSSAPVYTLMPTDGDNIYCIMHSSLTCAAPASVISANNITMISPPIYVPIVTIHAYPGTRIHAGMSDTLVTSVVFAGLSYTLQWKLNSAPIPGATTDTFISNTLLTNDVVSCEVTGMNTCGSATNTGSVTIIDTIGVGVHPVNISGADIRLVPNPNKGAFTILGTLLPGTSEDVTIEITDMLGQVVYSNIVNAANGKIDQQISLRSSLANGMYILNLHTGNVNKTIHFVVEQ